MKQLTMMDLGEMMPCECPECKCPRLTVSVSGMVERGVIARGEYFEYPKGFTQANRRFGPIDLPKDLIPGNPERIQVRVCANCRYDHLGSW